MTDSRQHAESTTLQPYGTAAAVGNTNYVRVACPRYAAASCFCRSLSFVTPPYHTFLLYIRTSKNSTRSNNLDGPTNPSLHIHVHRGSFLTEYFFCFIFAKIADDKTAADNVRRSKRYYRGRTMVRVPYPLLTAASCFCHSLSRIVLLLPRAQ